MTRFARNFLPHLSLLSLLALPLPAAAQEVSYCGERAGAEFLLEPWEANTRSFANGDVRLAVLDLIEPGAVPFHLMLLFPPKPDEEMAMRECRLISFEGGMGFHAVYFDGLKASYDPARGLLFDLPVQIIDEMGIPVVRGLFMTLNRATAQVTAQIVTEPVLK